MKRLLPAGDPLRFHRRRTVARSAPALAAGALIAALGGCPDDDEVVGDGDAAADALGDVTQDAIGGDVGPDVLFDAGPGDVGPGDAGPDALVDAGPGPDAGPDAGPGLDAGPDAIADVVADAIGDAVADVVGDVVTDAIGDIGLDISFDIAFDVFEDVSLDIFPDVTLDVGPGLDTGPDTAADTADAPDSIDPTITFVDDIHPLLITACSTCHSPAGIASGTDFVLTGDPVADLPETIDFVDTADPAASPLLMKGAGLDSHAGGPAIAADSPEYDLILAWIAAGAVD